MNTRFAISPDGQRVAFDVSGKGPAIVLLHGGGRTRQDWHEVGYVKRLRDYFTVITVDLRGHGESAMPTEPADYTTDKMGQDILAAADACGAEHFTIWGMSHGGNVGRYLAVQSERVVKIILMGTPFGLGVSGELRQYAQELCEHWPPIMQAQRDGRLDVHSLSQTDQDFLRRFDVPVALAWVRAMLDWPAVEPADMPCPTLWLVGSQDRHAMSSVKKYEEALKTSKVQVHIVEGFDHEQVFSEIETVLPTMFAFTQC